MARDQCRSNTAPLQDKLVDISYGMGRMNLILQDASDPAQGASVAMPMDDFPTGVMRGRFHPATGDLYACGMAVWASNKTQDGGLYRVRRVASPLRLPVAWRTAPGAITLTFSEPLDKASAEDLSHFTLTAWDLRRSEKYGSPHLNERPLAITRASVAADARTITLTVPALAPTPGLELKCILTGRDGQTFTRTIHATIHRLAALSSLPSPR